MPSSSIKSILRDPPFEQNIIVRGWVKTRRDSKSGVSFIHINDGSCLANLQILAPQTLSNYETEILKITTGCSLIVSGKMVLSPGKGQNCELIADNVSIVGWINDPDHYPIQPKKHTLEYLREVAHLRPRTNIVGIISRLRHAVSLAIHQYLSQEGFFWIHTPIITTSDCEGAGKLFRVSCLDFLNTPLNSNKQVDFSKDFFGKETFLTVSGQLNVEAYCLALTKVYTFGPTFRAENSNTSRHLSEFWMIEPEIAFANLTDNINVATNLLKYVVKMVMEKHSEDLAFCTQQHDPCLLERLESFLLKPFEQMTYTDAIEKLTLAKQNFEFPVKWGMDLQTEHERYLCEQLTKRTTIITDYPKEIKSFYMRVNSDNKTVAAMDILVPGIGEIIGGSQREERLNILDDRLNELKLNKENYQWYRDLRRYGTVPHAGFGLGLERLLSYISAVTNVRDLIPFPRTPNNADF